MNTVYRKVHRKRVVGKSFPVLVKDQHFQYILTTIEVYKDGKILCTNPGGQIAWGEELPLKRELSFEELVQAVAREKVVTTVPAGASITLFGLATFTISKIESDLAQNEIILLVRNILRELNGDPTFSQMCREAFLRFLDEPCVERQEALREAYEMVPSPRKIFILDDIENGDTAITVILSRDLSGISEEWLKEQRQEYSDLR